MVLNKKGKNEKQKESSMEKDSTRELLCNYVFWSGYDRNCAFVTVDQFCYRSILDFVIKSFKVCTEFKITCMLGTFLELALNSEPLLLGDVCLYLKNILNRR